MSEREGEKDADVTPFLSIIVFAAFFSLARSISSSFSPRLVSPHLIFPLNPMCIRSIILFSVFCSFESLLTCD